jgi:hypothetical protein
MKNVVALNLFLLLLTASLHSEIVLDQNFEDTSIFIIGSSFGTSGVGDAASIGGIWKNTTISGNYTPKTASGNSSFSDGAQCVSIYRTSTYGSGLTVGLRNDKVPSEEFELTWSMKFSDVDQQFTSYLVDSNGDTNGQVGIAYYSRSLQIRENGAYRSLNTTIPAESWFRMSIKGVLSQSYYMVYLDTGNGFEYIGEATFDNSQLTEVAGLYVGPWTQSQYIYIDDVTLRDEIIFQPPTIFNWSSDTFAIWTLKEDAPRADVPVSLPDWYVWFDCNYGRPAIRHILNQLAAHGVRHIWWRTIGGNSTGYITQVDGAMNWQPLGAEGEIRNFDPLAEAVEYGHKLGLKIYGWFVPIEEYHGSPTGGRSRYTDNHQDLWEKVYSSAYVASDGDCPSFFFSEYRDYKVSLANDIIRRYDIDGVVIDYERIGWRNNKWGYVEGMCNAFQAETGRDAWTVGPEDGEWMAFRAKYVGKVVSAVQKILKAKDESLEMIAWYPWEKPLMSLYDIETLASQGIFDRYAVFAYGNDEWGYPAPPTSGLYNTLTNQLQKPVMFGVYLASGSNTIKVECVDAGLGQGFDGAVWFESTPLMRNNLQSKIRQRTCQDSILIESPLFDITNGGQLYVLAAGQWQLGIDDLSSPIASGGGGVTQRVAIEPLAGSHKLVFSASLNADDPAGLAVEGYVFDADNQVYTVKSDSNWTNLYDSQPLLRFAQPGIPPFLGE